MTMKYTLYILTLLLTIISCHKPQENSAFFMSAVNGEEISFSTPPSELSAPDLVSFVQNENSGLKQHFTKNEFTYSAFYKPVDYIICKEQRSDKVETSIAKTKRRELQGMQYIDLRIAAKNINEELLKYNISPDNDYEKRIKYCSFEIQKDLQLVEGKDTIACSMVHYEREYGVTPYVTILLAFPINKKTMDEDKTLLFDDKLFYNGLIQFVFSNKNIKNTPKLKI